MNNNGRRCAPFRFGALITEEEMARMTEHVTGRSLEEWEARFARRRQNGRKHGKFTTRRLFPLNDGDSKNANRHLAQYFRTFCRYYGLWEADDFIIMREPVVKVIKNLSEYGQAISLPGDALTVPCARLCPTKYK